MDPIQYKNFELIMKELKECFLCINCSEIKDCYFSTMTSVLLLAICNGATILYIYITLYKYKNINLLD